MAIRRVKVNNRFALFILGPARYNSSDSYVYVTCTLVPTDAIHNNLV